MSFSSLNCLSSAEAAAFADEQVHGFKTKAHATVEDVDKGLQLDLSSLKWEDLSTAFPSSYGHCEAFRFGIETQRDQAARDREWQLWLGLCAGLIAIEIVD